VIQVFSGRRLVGYTPLVVTLLAFNVTSMTVWAHHMFTTGKVFNEYFALTSTMLLIFAGVEYFDAVATMWGGAIRLDPPMLFALGFLLQFVIGGVTGVIVASPPLDYNLNDTYFVVAHFHYTLFAGSLFGLLAGVYYWYPKITGYMLDRRLGIVQFWLLVIGTNLTFFPMFMLGYRGMVRRVADYPAHAGLTGLNELSTLGSWVVGVAMLVLLWNLVTAPRRGVAAGADPWSGHTLEWAANSPPPRHNFDALPPIVSAAPLLDARKQREAAP
jgi:cytochrome c oxidase subunit 1